MTPPIVDWAQESVLVTGGRGFLGRHVVAALKKLRPRSLWAPTHVQLDLLVRRRVERFLQKHRPGVVFHLAADVGGIGANVAHGGRFAYANLVMGAELLEACRKSGVRRVVVASTTCTYPADAPVPLRVADWWDGYPARETAPYGLAKKMLFVLGEGFRREHGLSSSHVILANLYGEGDHFDEKDAHVIPALIRRFVEAKSSGAKEVICWGTGGPTREFLYVSDAAQGLVLAAEKDEGLDPLNLGSGEEITIRDLAAMIAAAVGYTGMVRFDPTRPDGQMRRCLESSAARALGFAPSVTLRAGIARTVRWMEKLLRREVP